LGATTTSPARVGRRSTGPRPAVPTQFKERSEPCGPQPAGNAACSATPPLTRPPPPTGSGATTTSPAQPARSTGRRPAEPTKYTAPSPPAGQRWAGTQPAALSHQQRVHRHQRPGQHLHPRHHHLDRGYRRHHGTLPVTPLAGCRQPGGAWAARAGSGLHCWLWRLDQAGLPPRRRGSNRCPWAVRSVRRRQLRAARTAAGSPRDPDPSRGWSGSTQDLLVLGPAQLFRGLDPGDVAALLPAFGVRTLERGATLFRQGDVGDAQVFIVLQGRFTVAREHRAGRSVSAVLGPGDMAGDLSVFDPGRGPAPSPPPPQPGWRCCPPPTCWPGAPAVGTSRAGCCRYWLAGCAAPAAPQSTWSSSTSRDGSPAPCSNSPAGSVNPRGTQLWVAHGLTQTELA